MWKVVNLISGYVFIQYKRLASKFCVAGCGAFIFAYPDKEVPIKTTYGLLKRIWGKQKMFEPGNTKGIG
jgi:hypothetical protein